MTHTAGFVAIVGKPNAGKSTLMNALIGEKLSIITPKAQTTRHKILGIINEPDTQIIFCDTPGIIKPRYGLQEKMMDVVNESMANAEVVLLVIDIAEPVVEDELIQKIMHYTGPLAILLNKIDTVAQDAVSEKIAQLTVFFPEAIIIPISALEKFNTESIMTFVRTHLPEHPAYYDKDAYTDRSLRFIISELVREQIFFQYQQEIPYSTEVIITKYNEQPLIDRIYAEIIVERESQKMILIGEGGSKLKKVGTSARIHAEKFLDKKVFIQLIVKVIPDWRNKSNYLKQFGYEK